MISDIEPQFKFIILRTFWKNRISKSPGNQQTNGKAKSAVKSAKHLIKKNKDTHTVLFMILIDIRNITTQGMESSPFQCILNYRTDMLLPIRNLLKLRMVSLEPSDKTLWEHKQKAQVKYYNHHAHDLAVLSEGDVVQIPPYKNSDTQTLYFL